MIAEDKAITREGSADIKLAVRFSALAKLLNYAQP